MIHKRYLMAFAISFFTCLEALAQFAGVVEQFPTSDFSSKPVYFKLSEITAALETNAATLVDALDSWANEESEPNMFFLKLADGLSDNYSDGKGCFWVNVAGIPQEWNDDNSDLRWYSNIGWNIEDDVFIIYMGQYPDQCAVGDEFNPVFVLKYGEKTVDLYVTFRIVAKPEIPAPTTLIESELNIVGEKEIIVEQNPRNDYEADTIKVNIRDAISELGIENNMILTDMLGEILYCTDGSYSDTGLFIKKDNLSNESTADYPGYWLGAIQNEEEEETGECSRVTWGDNNKFYVAPFFYTPETSELSCRLGQKPGILMSGEHFFVNLYLIYGDKAYRLIYRLNMLGEIISNTDVITSKDEASTKGFYYNLIFKTKEAEVISNPNKYRGEIIVPESVEYNGDVYTVTSIGESAFNANSITSVILPNTIKTIKSNAFYNCSNLNRIVIRKGVTSIGDHAFTFCKGIKSIYLPKSLTSIGSSAFAFCSGLSALTIPDNVTIINDHTFEECTNLETITISNNVTSIGDAAFWNCTNLTSISIPNSVTSIEGYAFRNCSKLTSVSMGNSVKNIYYRAFTKCTCLTSVHISDLVAWCNISFEEDSNPLSFAHHLILNGDEIKNLIIPSGVTTIHNRSFSGCSGITSVVIPNSVTSIGWNAFSDCSGITSIIVGNSVKSISSSTFANCPELTDVLCYAEAVPWTESNAFDGSYIDYATLHVPEVAYESYRTTEPWSNFGTIKVIDGETPVVEKCATPTITYANGKVKFACETEGVEFVPSITVTPNQLQNGNELAIGGNFTVSVYAVKEGYDNSDTATMTINMSQMGDVNADGELNAADITAVVNAILGK